MESQKPINIFVSSEQDPNDQRLTDELMRFIRREVEGAGAAFCMDRDVPATGEWNTLIKKQLARADIALILVSQRYLASKYITDTDIEDFIKRRKEEGLIIFPIILSECSWEKHEWLFRTQFLPNLGTIYVDYHGPKRIALFEDIARHLVALVHELQSRDALQSEGSASVSIPECPYRGLLAFREQDAPYFFGRELITNRLVEKVERTSMVALVGFSGSGKSSLVFAGLLPSLRKMSDWVIAHFRPGVRPYDALAVALMPLFEPEMSEPQLSIAIGELANALKQGHLYIVVQQLIRKHGENTQFLLFIDQFEELYTLCQDLEMRTKFLNALLELARSYLSSQSPFRLVLSLRGDFYSEVVRYRPFSEMLQDNIVNLPPMDREELKRAIELPAHQQGVAFEDKLVERILDDAGNEPGNLPLLEFSLMLMWQRQTNRTLTHAVYEDIGELVGAIARRAETEYQNLTPVQQQAARHVLSRLVRVARPDEEGNDARRRAALSELSDHPDDVGDPSMKVIHALTNARLLVMDHDNITGEQTVEVAHEAVFRNWDRLRAWLVEDREFLLWQQRLHTIITEWKLVNKEEGLLLRGPLLNEAEKWLAAKPSDELTQEQHDFILQSIKLRDKEAEVRALVQVEFLLNARMEEINNIIKNFSPYRRWVDPQLRSFLESGSPHQEQWRIRLALLPVDHDQAEQLVKDMLMASPQELLIIRDALLPYKDELKDDLWRIIDDWGIEGDRQFRAACALALFDPSNERWKSVSQDLVAKLVTENLLHLKEWVQALRPVSSVLLASLRARFGDDNERDTIREAAGTVLADFTATDPELLAVLASESMVQSYEMFYRLLTAKDIDYELAKNTLRGITREQPSDQLLEIDRVRLGRRRAIAAITLVRMGEREDAFEVFQISNDPESLTQFVHQSKDRGVKWEELLECLDRTVDEHARFALLLSLGAFKLDEAPKAQQRKLAETLGDWYRNDPSSAIHGACGWLLRTWDHREILASVDHSPLPYDPTGERQWFVLEVGEDHMTFVVYPPGEFLMGSPISEKDRYVDETPLHRVRITRPFAMCDREVTRGQFERFMKIFPLEGFPNIDEWSPNPNELMVAITWYEAVRYCRWLTDLMGMAESDQCYDDPDRLQKRKDGYPVDWPLHHEKSGFHLPTEAEWEYACRCGTNTAYSFGNDRKLLDQYGWFQSNSGYKTNEAGVLRPNLRGLFNMHGNCWEWCHDWYGSNYIVESDPEQDPIGLLQGERRVLRGGCWNLNEKYSRSAHRNGHLPTNRNYYIGFRLVLSCPRPKE